MKTKITVGLLLFAGVLVCGTASRSESVPPQQGQTAVVFAVSANRPPSTGDMLPILLIERGEFKNPVAGDSDESEIKRFAGNHYRRGQNYRLIFGGVEAGSVSVSKFVGGECGRTNGNVSIKSRQPLNVNVMALATDSKTVVGAASASSRRRPTESERTQAMELARAAYREKGVPAALLAKLQTINLTATDLNHDGRAELVGSFVASKRTRPQLRYVLFLVAESDGANYKRSHLTFDKLTDKDIMDGADMNAINDGVYVETLIDHLNLDSNGWDELFTLKRGFEGDSYQAYKRQNGRWTSVYEFNNYRCAF